MNRRSLFFLYSFLLFAVILFEYGRSFNFYFVGDDFAFIEYVVTEKGNILWKPSCFYHYYPLGLFLMAAPAIFNAFEPSYFVGVSFVLFFLCALMILLLFRKIMGGLTGGFLAALIYATAVPNAEVIYWKSGTHTIAMTLFSLISLAFFIRCLEKKSKAAFLASMAAFFASILSIEQGIVTFGILFLYDVIFHSIPKFRISSSEQRTRIIAGFAGRYCILIVPPLSMMLIKRMIGAQLAPFSFSQLFPRIPHLTGQTLLRLYDFNRVTFNFSLSDANVWALVVALTVIFSAYLFFRKTTAGLFFFLSSMSSILVISLAAGGPNERYFCLPLAFFACFLSIFLKDAAVMIARFFYLNFSLVRAPCICDASRAPSQTTDSFAGENNLGRTQNILLILLCLIIIVTGIHGTLQRRFFWNAASDIERNIVRTVENIYLAGSVQERQKLYLLNVPAFFSTRNNSIFYVCSNSLIPDLKHRLGKSADAIIPAATGNLFEMNIRNEPILYRALGRQNMLDRGGIRLLLSEGHLVYQFSPQVMTVVPLKDSR